ncbi:MAG: hypothetical protein U9N42_02120, partial [Campylobacterota bacterium]|nr:hypothetical protein [Campylobacterota bacterium]
VEKGYSTFETVESSKAYWVLSSGSSVIENKECQNISNEIAIKKGWNFISSSKSLSAEDLESENILHVWQYYDGNWRLQANIENSLHVDKIEKIYKEDGFWLYAKDDAHITLN